MILERIMKDLIDNDWLSRCEGGKRMVGIGRTCLCGKLFICTDGDPFCSDTCYDKWEEINEEE